MGRAPGQRRPTDSEGCEVTRRLRHLAVAWGDMDAAGPGERVAIAALLLVLFVCAGVKW